MGGRNRSAQNAVDVKLGSLVKRVRWEAASTV